MLISKITEAEDGLAESLQCKEDNQEPDYEDIFERTLKNNDFNDQCPLTTSDLVFLYKKLDLDTQTVKIEKRINKRPNQYVENVVYNGDPDSDEISDVDAYGTDDVEHLFEINDERLDLISNIPSLENTLCHKCGNLEILSSNLTSEYNRHLICKNSFLNKWDDKKISKNQFDLNVLPVSLMGYLSSKNFEDSYDYYMDNVIIYVKHTIEQLKRISNGDYLTDHLREKWIESDVKRDNEMRAIATTTSIPLQIACKNTEQRSNWDNVIHSAIDIKTLLSKVVENRIIIEIPKLIPLPYKLFTKHCNENLVVSCKINKNLEKKGNKSRLNVLFSLKRSESDYVLNNINSIMILNTPPDIQLDKQTVLPLPYKPLEITETPNWNNEKIEIIELDEKQQDESQTQQNIEENQASLENSFSAIENVTENDTFRESTSPGSDDESIASSLPLKDFLDKTATDTKHPTPTSHRLFSIDELRVTMMRLNKQGILTEDIPEETVVNKNKSPIINRVKSPYQNKSNLIEEKKRNKLLEIRQQREKKKVVMNRGCKINKQKYGKGAAIPHGSNSVTRLSITNKYFYNSIYGSNNLQIEEKPSKIVNRKLKKEFYDNLDEENEYEERTDILTPEKNSKKYINRSYYLDDAITEVMCMTMKEKERKEEMSESTSVTSNDTNANLKFITQFINPSATNLSVVNVENIFNNNIQRTDEDNLDIDTKCEHDTKYICTGVPSNSPIKDVHIENTRDKKVPAAVECRKSIENVYDLIKQLKGGDHVQINAGKSNIAASTLNNRKKVIGCTDSNASFKHYLRSIVQSSTNIDEINIKEIDKNACTFKETLKTTATVVPKIKISTKSMAKKTEEYKRERKKISIGAPVKASPNPLKAISQLLHEFDNIQKTRLKNSPERKVNKKADSNLTEERSNLQTNLGMRHSRLDQPMKINIHQRDRYNRSSVPKDMKTKLIPVESPKIVHQPKLSEDKHNDKLGRRNIADIIDEAKEAKGEAVRGPSKLVSRLETLAQPKKSYVQAHSAEYQNKYGRNLLSDRLQRLVTAQTSPCFDRKTGSASARNRRRRGTEVTSLVSVKYSPKNHSSERLANPRRSSSSSPNRKAKTLKEPFLKPDHVPVSPETIMRKMKAVETYVKSHYGGGVGNSVVGEISLGPNKPSTRPPLIPADIELSSMTSSPTVEESTALGSKLHRIINTIVGPEVFNNDSSNNNIGDDFNVTKETKYCSSLRNIPYIKGPSSLDSDFPVDIFQDKYVLTAVEGFVEKDDHETKKQIADVKSSCLQQPSKSKTELDDVDNKICRMISLSSFPKRLKINKLTLTPKHSLQRVILLQSGDAAAIVMKSQHDLEITSTKSENSPNIKLFPTMSAHINWGFTKMPMQISTVGYAFPKHNKSCTSTEIKFTKGEARKICNKYLKKSFQTGSKWTNKNDEIIENYRDETNLVEVLVKSNQDKAISAHLINSESSNVVENNTPVELKEIVENKNAETQISMNTELKAKIPFNDCNSKKECGVGYTESLDMLVGLLNEIQKITTCQTHITSNLPDTDSLKCPNKASKLKEDMENKFPEIISITSLDRLRRLESSLSILSSYESDDNKVEPVNRVDAMCDVDFNVKSDENKMEPVNRVDAMCDIDFNVKSEENKVEPVHRIDAMCDVDLGGNKNVIYADKEVSAGFAEKEYCNTFTNVPSQFLPVMETHSTNVSNSNIGIISEPSSESLMCGGLSNLCFHSKRKIIELTKLNNFMIISQNTHENCDIKPNEANTVTLKSKNVCKTQVMNESDQVVNMKRDLLVAVYSILVITVFAALSIPEMLLTFDY